MRQAVRGWGRAITRRRAAAEAPGARARRARRRRPTRAQRRARAPGARGARRRGRCTHVIHPGGYLRGDTGQRRGSGR